MLFNVMPAFVTGLDWSNADEVTPEEQRILERWYKETHGFDPDDPGSLTGFIDFWLRERPDVAKTYRRIIEASCGIEVLPQAAMGLLFLHMYAIMPSPNGVMYEVIASRFWGASRAQVIETLAFSFIHGGPHGMGVATSAADDYLRQEWPEETGATVVWPEGWAPDPDALASGIDYFDDAFTAADLAALRAWHERVEGEVPAYVDFFAERNPLALKAFRHRFETTLRGALPKQMAALYLMQTAGLRGNESGMRRAAHMARTFGVSEEQITHMVSTLDIYTGHVSTDDALRGLLG
jgi:hypothetical protein